MVKGYADIPAIFYKYKLNISVFQEKTDKYLKKSKIKNYDIKKG